MTTMPGTDRTISALTRGTLRLNAAEVLEHDQGAAPAPPVEMAELADIVGEFNAVTERLHAAHSSLQSRVDQLRGELETTNRRLQRSEQLAALGRMAAAIAHEIRNPLASIRLYASMLADDLEPGSPSRDTALRISRSVRDLDQIVEDVLLFSRDHRPATTDVSVTALVQHVIESAAGLAADSGVTIRLIEPGDEVPAISVDVRLITQALLNVIRNAIEAMDGTGSVEISAHSGGSTVTLVLRDFGPGVSEEVMERVFDPFFTTRSSGTGLGLAIVNRIIDAHGGRIELRNASNGPGAEVHIELPCAMRQSDLAA